MTKATPAKILGLIERSLERKEKYITDQLKGSPDSQFYQGYKMAIVHLKEDLHSFKTGFY